MRLLVAPLVFSIPLALACGSFSASEEPPVDAPDGSKPGDDAAAIVEAAPPSDAALDAGDPPCGFVEFVDLFDRADVQGTWLDGPKSGDGIVITSGSAPVPRGLSWQVAVQPSTGNRYRNYTHVPATMAASPTCIELGFSIYPGAVTGTGMAVGSIELDGGTSLSLWIRPNGTIEAEEQTTDGTVFELLGTAALPATQWHSIRLRYDYATPGTKPRFVVDDKSIAVNVPTLDHGAPTKIYFGAGFTPKDTSAAYWLDELRVH